MLPLWPFLLAAACVPPHPAEPAPPLEPAEAAAPEEAEADDDAALQATLDATPDPALEPLTGPPSLVYTFAGAVPAGWSTKGQVLAHEGVIVIGDATGAVSLICTPFAAAAGPVRGNVTRAFVVPEAEAETWSRIEARAFGADKRRLPGAKTQLLASTRAGSTMASVTFAWTPPEGAAWWRLCVKTGGKAKGSTVLKEISFHAP